MNKALTTMFNMTRKMNGGKDNKKDTMLVLLFWLMAISLIYIVFIKFKIFLH